MPTSLPVTSIPTSASGVGGVDSGSQIFHPYSHLKATPTTPPSHLATHAIASHHLPGENVPTTSSSSFFPTHQPFESGPLNIADVFAAGHSKSAPQSLAAYRWHKAYEYVKRQNALKKKALVTPIGTGAKMHGHSLGMVPLDDDFRRGLFHNLYNSKAEYLLLGIISSHVFVLVLKAENKMVTSFMPKKGLLDAADIVLTVLYTLEMLSRIFVLGLCKGPHTYCRNSFNKLDLIIVVDSWAHIARTVIMKRDAFFRIAILRMFRILLCLREFNAVGNILAIMDAIAKSLYSLRTVLVFTLMFLSFYALVGVLFFGGTLHNRCIRDTDYQLTYPQRFCITDYSLKYGYLCPSAQDQYCLPYQNPNWGVSNYDNYGAAMLIMFQLMTFEGWALQMYSVNDTNGYANVYFVIFVVLGAYFLVNIYTAAVSSVFLRVRHEHQILLKKYKRDKELTFANAIEMANLLKDIIIKDDDNAKLTWGQWFRRKTIRRMSSIRASLNRQGTRLKRGVSRAVDWNDPNSYLKRISSFGLSGTDGDLDRQEYGQSSRSPTLGRTLSRNLSMGGQRVAQLGRTFSRNLSLSTIMAASTVSQKAYLITSSKVFLYGVLTLISLNMAGLCTMRADMSEEHIHRLEIMEIGVLIVFTFEMVLRFVAEGFSGFIDERMNVVDVLVIGVSYGFTGFSHRKKFPNLTPIRMLRWFYKKNSHMEDLGESLNIVAAVIRSFGSLSSVFFFFGFVIFIFSIIGMELWGGQFSNFVEGYPRANFDSFFQSMLLWFSVTTAESWPNQMWNTMRPGVAYKFMGPVLFVMYYMLTAIVILNLIMAVILEQTELTDNQKKYIQKRDHIKWLQTKHAHHVSSTRGSDWLAGAVHGAHKGYKGMVKRMSTMRVSNVSRLSLFPVYQPDTGFVRMVSSSQPAPPTYEDTLPRTITKPPISPAAAAAPPSGKGGPSRRHSYTAVTIPGTADEEETTRTKARIFRRSSMSALSSAGLLPQTISGGPQRARRPSHDAEKVMLRSGFLRDLTTAPSGAENRTVLQTALLNVVQEQREFTKITEEEKRAEAAAAAIPDPVRPPDSRALRPALGKMPSRKEKGRVSFSLADYEGLQAAGEKKRPWWMSDVSLFLFTSDNRFRVWCVKLAENKWYLYWQYLFITISCFIVLETKQLGGYLVLMDEPNFLYSLEQLSLIVFVVDFFVKIIAYGFLLTPEPYLGDPFNFIDVFSLIVHLMRTKDRGPGYWFNTFLLLSCTRPARFIVRVHGLRSLTVSIFKTMPAIGQVFIFTIVIYAIFAVIGMQLFANRFRYCNDPGVTGHADCVGNAINSVGIMTPRVWMNPPFHFDAFGEAMLALFIASTFDNWLNYFAYTSMDIAHQDEMQPQRNTNPSLVLFFVCFVCVGGFFILRMFIGVFIDQFGIISGTKLLTEKQKLWRDTNRIIQSLKPTRLQKHTPGVIRGFCYRLIHSRRFELGVIFVILANYGFLASQHWHQATSTWVFDTVEAMFVSLYLFEALLKLLGTQFDDWWHHKWNLIELIMVLMSAACLWPERGSLLDNNRRLIGGFFYLLRIFRVIRYVPHLSNMVSTVMISLPGMVDIVSLMGIVLFFFAGVGTNLFTNLKDGNCFGFHTDMTFFSFTTGLVVLFQVTTLDNWSCLLPDMTVSSPFCTKGVGLYENDCGYPVGAIVYMLVLVCVTSYIFTNLFVAQILDCITFGLLDEDAMLTPSHLYGFQQLWAQKEFDYHCTGYIGHHKLRQFLSRLGPPLGRRLFTFRDKWITRIEYEAFYFRSSKGIPFRALLETLVLYKIGPRGLELPVRIERERQLQNVYRHGAAMKIQALFRGHRDRKRLKNAPPMESREGKTVQHIERHDDEEYR